MRGMGTRPSKVSKTTFTVEIFPKSNGEPQKDFQWESHSVRSVFLKQDFVCSCNV